MRNCSGIHLAWRCDLFKMGCKRNFFGVRERDANEALPLTKFWTKNKESYPFVADVPLRAMLMFPSTHMCEQGFSATFCMKTKLRARPCVKADIRLCLLKTVPRIEALVLT